MIGSRSEAEDLLQETYIKMLRGLANYREDGRFEPWLFSIAANLARDWLRRQGRSTVMSIAGKKDESESTFAFEGPGPDQTLAQAEQLDLLQQAVNDLSPAEREVISLRFFAADVLQGDCRDPERTAGNGVARAIAHSGICGNRFADEQAPSAGRERGVEP